MKLGLFADIHEFVEALRAALWRFEQEGVDQVIVIGDLCAAGYQLDETCRLLAEAKAIGVWGNHDFGLCGEPTAEMRLRYSPSVLDYMKSLRPRLEIEGCHFSHVEPWLNSENLEDLWSFEGISDDPQSVRRIFDAVDHSVIFAGHWHRWLLASEEGIDAWQGERPIKLSREQRHFAVIHALCDGYSALFDTQTRELIPLQVD